MNTLLILLGLGSIIGLWLLKNYLDYRLYRIYTLHNHYVEIDFMTLKELYDEWEDDYIVMGESNILRSFKSSGKFPSSMISEEEIYFGKTYFLLGFFSWLRFRFWLKMEINEIINE